MFNNEKTTPTKPSALLSICSSRPTSTAKVGILRKLLEDYDAPVDTVWKGGTLLCPKQSGGWSALKVAEKLHREERDPMQKPNPNPNPT